MISELKRALLAFLALTILTGVFYPLTVTVVAGVFFPRAAGGSLLVEGNEIVGSRLIGQSFDDARFFFSRPSATGERPYNGLASGGSNLGPTNPVLEDAVKSRLAALRAVDPENRLPVPIDLVTSSGSGLDPHISPASAEYQVARVARIRNLPESRIRELVARYTDGPEFGVLGETRVRVLELNRALEQLN